MRIGVVVLTWNRCEGSLACLRALVPQLGEGDRVYVADNGSVDGTEERVRVAFPQVVVIQNGANLGFAGGNNPGIRRALDDGMDWVLLLNDDTLPAAGTLEALRARALDAPPDIGALQPLLVTDRDTVDSAGHALARAPGVRDLWAGDPVADVPGTPVEVFGACAAAALVRAEALRSAGPFDARMFVLFEDVDLMLRIRAAGFRVMLVPDVRVLHARGVSGDRRKGDREARARRRFWAQRNIVALAISSWPTGLLVMAAPVVALRVAIALWLGARHGLGGCLALWRHALRTRPGRRAAMRRHAVDEWFGRSTR